MNRKLTDTEIFEIRTLAAIRTLLTNAKLAELYHASESHVDKITSCARRPGIDAEPMTIAEARDYLFGYVR